MRVSYAQRLEDFHLEQVFHDVQGGFYIDVGGGHPVADNVSFHFYLKGWRGLVVEPQAALASSYRCIRPRDLVVTDLVGLADGEADFHAVDRLHGFSTMLEEHARGAEAFGASYRTERRKVRALSSLIREHRIAEIDFLKVDVEGAEAAVLGGMDWSGVRPKVLCIEAVQPGSMADAWSEWEPALIANGYRFAYFDALNRFYVAEEHAALSARFPSGETDWGVVTHFYEFGRADENTAHPDHALAKRLVRGFLAGIAELDDDAVLALLARSAGPGGLESGDALARLLGGRLASPDDLADGIILGDAARAAIGRIAAQYDGGMINDD